MAHKLQLQVTSLLKFARSCIFIESVSYSIWKFHDARFITGIQTMQKLYNGADHSVFKS